jgi:lysophospholipase L1-like esterase
VEVVAIDAEEPTAAPDAGTASGEARQPPLVPDADPGDDVAAEVAATEIGVVVDPGRPGGSVPLPLPLPMPGTVAVVGDSLTLSAVDEIEDALTGAGLEVLAVDGVESRRMVRGGSEIPPGVDAIDDILTAGHEPELWIIALGTNDVGNGIDEPQFSDDVAAVLTTVPAGAPVPSMPCSTADRCPGTLQPFIDSQRNPDAGDDDTADDDTADDDTAADDTVDEDATTADGDPSDDTAVVGDVELDRAHGPCLRGRRRHRVPRLLRQHHRSLQRESVATITATLPGGRHARGHAARARDRVPAGVSGARAAREGGAVIGSQLPQRDWPNR